MTTLAMHQPNFLPWAGFFYKMRLADIFVILDTAQVPTGGSYANRVKIKTPRGPEWLTVPLKRGGKPSYAEQELAADARWVEKTMKTLHANYARSPWHGMYADDLDILFRNSIVGMPGGKPRSLAKLNRALIRWLQASLGLYHDTCVVVFSQEDLPKVPKEELPIMLCREFGATTYLSGTGARVYNDPGMFDEAGIELKYMPEVGYFYSQLWGEFEGGLSILDMLFNCGPAAVDMIKGVG